MVLRCELISHVNALLNISAFKDYAPNGLQVEGAATISKLCTAVTASQSVIDEAIRIGAQALLVHHGFFWTGENAALTGAKRRRIASLLSNNINLLAYHLPLDCHLELGNNRGFGKALGVVEMESTKAGNVDSLLWSGYFNEPQSCDALVQTLQNKLQREPQVIMGHARKIKKVAWCTGAAQDFLLQAVELGADAFISGEVSERTYYQAMEENIVYICAGHHATERFGVQQLGQYLKEHFSIEHHFIDAPNPI